VLILWQWVTSTLLNDNIGATQGFVTNGKQQQEKAFIGTYFMKNKKLQLQSISVPSLQMSSP
jgi:hypothetical protein